MRVVVEQPSYNLRGARTGETTVGSARKEMKCRGRRLRVRASLALHHFIAIFFYPYFSLAIAFLGTRYRRKRVMYP